MPQHKSAKKRVKTNLKCQQRNRAMRSTLRTSLKAIREMPEDQKDEAVRQMQRLTDRAVNKGIIHKNKAARIKARFSS